MKKTSFIKHLSLLLCTVLIAVTALFTIGCKDNSADKIQNTDINSDLVTTVLGDGQNSFSLIVADGEGNESLFEIHTDKGTVGQALLELELISGDESEYGLYIKTVNGITADYDKDKTYWAFYIDGEYALSGVDKTEITAGTTYSLRVEK